MRFCHFFLFAFSCSLLPGSAPQDLNDLFSVYGGILNATVQQYYNAHHTFDTTTASIPVHVNSTENVNNIDFDDDDFEDDMEDFFYENGFVEISNDDVYDYSYKPHKPSDGSLINATSLPDATISDVGETIEEDIIEETSDDNVDQSTLKPLQTPDLATSIPVRDELTTVDPSFETNYHGEAGLNVELTDHIIPAFVHPINRPSNEWPLNATQVGNPTNLTHRKPVRQRPIRRRRPLGNKRPQKGGIRFKKRRRRPNGNRKPVRVQNNKSKRKRYHKKKRPVKNKFFGSGNCGACQCGVTTTRRIVGGSLAAVNEFPWLALLAYDGTIQCGGTLINDRYVLTAAHCVRGFSISKFQIRFLEYNRASNTDTTLVIRTAARIYSLNSYKASTSDNDIGIIKLSAPIVFSTTTVRPVCLPLTGTDFTGYTGTIAGWGATSENGQLSKILRKTKVPILSNPQCKLIGMSITKNMLCAGRILSGGVDACQGDSGGPLMVVKNKRYYLAGIVSWGDGCARPKKPGVYTRVTRYLSWIRRLSVGSCSCY